MMVRSGRKRKRADAGDLDNCWESKAPPRLYSGPSPDAQIPDGAEAGVHFRLCAANRRPPATHSMRCFPSPTASSPGPDHYLPQRRLRSFVGFPQPRFGRGARSIARGSGPDADSAVLSAINTRMVTPADFIRVGSAVSLKPSGRRRLSAPTGGGWIRWSRIRCSVIGSITGGCWRFRSDLLPGD